MEMENRIKGRDNCIEKQVLLLEGTRSLTELEKLKADEKLQKSQRKCEEMRETVARLIVELSASRQREGRVEEMYAKNRQENLKMKSEMNRLKLEFDKINQNKLKETDSKTSSIKKRKDERENEVDKSLMQILRNQKTESFHYKPPTNKMENLVRVEFEVKEVEKGREKNMKMQMENLIRENDKLKLELNEKMTEFRKKDLEGERLLGKYMEKFRFSDEKLVRIEDELENLRWEKLVADQTVEDLRREKSVADQMVEDLRREKLDADRVIEDLKRQNLEANQMMEELRVNKLMESNNLTTSSFAARDIIKICDSDDEINAAGGEKRTGTGNGEDSKIDLIRKRKRSIKYDDEKETEVEIADSTDSEDESCSDSHIDELVASLQRRK